MEDLKGIGPVFYMPHRPVVREKAVSTKVPLTLPPRATMECR